MPPVASTIDTLSEYALEFLALCEAAAAVTAAGIPDLVYLATPGPAWDCEQLTVETLGLGDHPLPTTSALGEGRRLTAAINTVGFRVVIVRCAPAIDENGNMPEPADIEAAATQLNSDLWSIWTRVRTAYKDGDLFGGDCDHLWYDGAFQLETAGGFAGYQLDFRAEIAGFGNSGS